MTSTLTLSGLAVPLQALRLLAVDFPHLPAPNVGLCPLEPAQLRLSFHSGLDVFEAWREALGVSPDTVTHALQGGGGTRVLKASASYAGASLYLIGFTDVAPAGGAS
ncbi:hypothetical protein [Streptomyces olivaceus]